MSDEDKVMISDEEALDELFGEEEVVEEKLDEDQDAAIENIETKKETDGDAEFTRRKLNLALFGDDESEEEVIEESSAPSQDSPQKLKSTNVLGKKDLTLPESSKLDQKLYMLKLPGFIAVEGEPYDRYKLEEEEISLLDTDDLGNPSREGLLRLSTSIRCQEGPIDEDGAVQTNTHLIKWSDGSHSMLIGQEHFEVQLQNIQKENSFLFTRHAKEGCMEANGKLVDRLAVRPFITADQSHRKFMALSNSNETGLPVGRDPARVKMAVTVADPEREKQRMIKLEQEKIKSKRRLEMRRRNLQQRSYERVARTGLSASFLEEEDGAGSEDQDRYEDDFIDDNEGQNIDDEDELEAEEDEEEEDIEYSSAQESEASMASESEAQMTDDSAADEDETKEDKQKKKRSQKDSTPSRKAAKIIDSDVE